MDNRVAGWRALSQRRRCFALVFTVESLFFFSFSATLFSRRIALETPLDEVITVIKRSGNMAKERVRAAASDDDSSQAAPVTVVAFLIYPAPCQSFNVETLKGQAVCKSMKAAVDEIKAHIAERLFEACTRGRIPTPDELMLPQDRIHLKRSILSAKRNTLPPICTHNMDDDVRDPVLIALRRVQLFNHDDDRVKVIFHPEFLSATSPLIGLDYMDFVRGCHLGVFPSYYEPWGYTPAECTVLGIPSVTTNLSGFGCFIEERVSDPDSYGTYVIDRRFKNYEQSIAQLTDCMHKFSLLSRRQRVIIRNRTERLSELLDWNTLAKHYDEARQLALTKVHPELRATAASPMKVPPPISAPSTPGRTSPAQSVSDHEED